MKRLFVLTGSLAIVIACSNPSASAGNNFASTSAADPKPGAPAAGAPSSEAAHREITLPAGTLLPVDLETAVGSDISRVEQPVHARLRRAVTVNGVQVLPAGTAVSGHVTAARRPGRVKGRGYVAMRFTELDTPGAGMTRISTATIGRIAPATKEQDAVKILAPAVGGAVIGRIVDGKGADLSVKLLAPVTVRVPS